MRSLLVLGCSLVVIALPASSASAQRGYVSLRGSGSVGSFDSGVNAIDKTTAGFSDPTNNTITPTGNKLFVDDVDGNRLRVLNTGNSTVTTLNIGDGMFGVAISPSGNRLYACAYSNDYVAVIDPTTNATLDTHAVSKPVGVAVSPDGTKLYVSNDTTGDVEVLNSTTGAQLGTIAMAKARDILVSPDGSKLFVIDQAGNSVVIISTVTNAVIATVAGTQQANQLAVTPDGKKLYAAGLEAATSVTVVDAIQNLKLSTISGFDDATGVAVTAAGDTLYVSSSDENKIYRVNTSSNQKIDSFSALSYPADLALTPGQAPTASFVATAGPAGSPTSFNGSASTAGSDTVARYDWVFGDGATLSDGGPTPQHTYAIAGDYTLSLTVTNSDGVSTQQVFDGVKAMRNGASSAKTTSVIAISSPPAAAASPGPGPGPGVNAGDTMSSNGGDTSSGTGQGSSTTSMKVLPKLTLLKNKKLSIKGLKSLTVRAKGDAPLELTSTARITNRRGQKLKLILPHSTKLSLKKANRPKRLRFPLSKKNLRRLKQQLHLGKRLYASLTVTGKNGIDSVVQTTRIRLVLPKKKTK